MRRTMCPRNWGVLPSVKHSFSKRQHIHILNIRKIAATFSFGNRISVQELQFLKPTTHCFSSARFQGIHVDLSPASLACSQLQNYDPDRALTDYINRLEALQRRLGSVQSGKILKLSSSWYKDTEYLF